MTPERLADLEARIRRAVEAARAEGIQLRAGCFGVYRSSRENAWKADSGSGCCPLGCLILTNRLGPNDYRTNLNLTEAEVDGFWIGFDLRSPLALGYKYDPNTYELGRRLRDEWLP